MNMVFKRKLLIPKEIKEMYPISPEGAAAKRSNDESIRDILTGACCSSSAPARPTGRMP